MNALDEITEIGIRHELAKARGALHSQTSLIIAGALIISFLAGYIYRDQTAGNSIEFSKGTACEK